MTATEPLPSRQWDDDYEALVERDASTTGMYHIDSAKRYLLINRTPFVIHITREREEAGGGRDELLIPPFGQRVVSGERLAPFAEELRRHRQRNELRVRPLIEPEAESPKSRWLFRAIGLTVLAFVGVAFYDVFAKGSVLQLEFYAAALLAFVVIAVGLAVAHNDDEQRRAKEREADLYEADTDYGEGGAYTTGNETYRRASHLLTLILVMTIGAVLPVVAIIAGTDTRNFLDFEGGLHVLPDHGSKLVARIIQMTYTAVLSLFPALLFFQFDRHRIGTIRNQWVRSIFRMDNRMRTMADLNAYYGDELAEASNFSSDSVRFLGGKHSPIVVATILITLGWTVLVLRTESFDFEAETAAARELDIAVLAADEATEASVEATRTTDPTDLAAAVILADAARDTAVEAQAQATEIAADSSGESADESADSGMTSATEESSADDSSTAAELAGEAQAAATLTEIEASSIQSTPFFQLLAPTPSPAAMAFLGAYFFGVFLVLRSYFRGDLRPKVYNQITARLVTVVVVAYVINAMFAGSIGDSRPLLALAFLAGVVPTTVLRRMMLVVGAIAKSTIGRAVIPDAAEEAFSPSRPLTQIDGVDLYDASRLEAEGISDVPALADSRLAAVMINSRLPLGRLVDWADQAVLMVVLSSGKDEVLDSRIAKLRTFGVRGASDFLAICESGRRDSIAALDQMLATTNGEAPAPEEEGDEPAAVLMDSTDVCAAIRRQRVIVDVLQWRSSLLARVDHPWIALPGLDYTTIDAAGRPA